MQCGGPWARLHQGQTHFLSISEAQRCLDEQRDLKEASWAHVGVLSVPMQGCQYDERQKTTGVCAVILSIVCLFPLCFFMVFLFCSLTRSGGLAVHGDRGLEGGQTRARITLVINGR